MLCCFFNTVNSVLSLLGIIGVTNGSFLATNGYLFWIFFVINLSNTLFFIYKAYKNKIYKTIAILMTLGFFCININNFYQYKNHQAKFCKQCIYEEDDGCCQLQCGHHKTHNCKNISDSHHCQQKNSLRLGLQILGLIGSILTIGALILFFKTKNHHCSSVCDFHSHE